MCIKKSALRRLCNFSNGFCTLSVLVEFLDYPFIYLLMRVHWDPYEHNAAMREQCGSARLISHLLNRIKLLAGAFRGIQRELGINLVASLLPRRQISCGYCYIRDERLRLMRRAECKSRSTIEYFQSHANIRRSRDATIRILSLQ